MNIAWTIAGSDSSAGAGVQADIKTMHGFGVYCCTIITAITAQSTRGVFGIQETSPTILAEQIKSLYSDLKPSALKIGMVFSAKTVSLLSEMCAQFPFPVVYDPVMSATTGDGLMDRSAVDAIRTKLLPLSTLITPNWLEAHALLGRPMTDLAAMNEEEIDTLVESLALELLKLGPKSVLIKGGHIGAKFAQDYWTDGDSKVWLTSVRQSTTNTHGTGCTLSAAITASLAKKISMVDAIVIGKAYVNQGLRMSPNLVDNNGPLAHLNLQFKEIDLPWLTETAKSGRNRTKFQRDSSIGFYPIVPSADWVERLAKTGVSTIQLRIKNLDGEQLENEVARGIAIAKAHRCNLYVNDYWNLAVKHGAYGIHLGQEDLVTADLDTICNSGIRLGISTHCYSEVARALAVQPSYIAIGPIHPTNSKRMPFAPQGETGLARWRTQLGYPLVAIGGITFDNANSVKSAGADGIATISDVIEHANPIARCRQWLSLWPEQQTFTSSINPKGRNIQI